MKLADAHIHLFAAGYPGRYGALFPKGGETAMYESIRRVHDVACALVVGYEGEPWSQGNNRYIARLAATRSWIAPLAYCPAARAPRAPQLRTWRRSGFAGVSWYVTSSHEAEILSACSEEAAALLNDWQAIVSVNCPPDVAEILGPLFARLPETRILLSHLGLPGRLPAARANLGPVLRLASLPHVGVKISAAYACNAHPHPGLAGLVTPLRRAYGESRLYWGSDFSPALDEVTFAQAVSAFSGLAWERPEDVFSLNLRRLIGRVRR